MGRQRYFLKKNKIFQEPGDVIQTSAFGVRIHPVTGERKEHWGIDCCLWTGECMEATIYTVVYFAFFCNRMNTHTKRRGLYYIPRL